VENHCQKCGELLIPSPHGERSGTSGPYRVSVRGLPALTCPRGCAGELPDLSFPVLTLLGLLQQISRSTAKQTGFFKKRAVCRECGGDLVLHGTESTWTFTTGTADGVTRPIELAITGPGWLCPLCNKAYLPQNVDGQGLGQALSNTLEPRGGEQRG
jgi:hypothetical protein